RGPGRSPPPRRPRARAGPRHRPRNRPRPCGCPSAGRCGSPGRRSRRDWRSGFYRTSTLEQHVMAGLVPAIHVNIVAVAPSPPFLLMGEAWVYMMTNRPNGTLYTGVTRDIARRVWEHREGVAEGFTKRYGLKRLVYVERHADIHTAIQRDHNMKHWPRTW